MPTTTSTILVAEEHDATRAFLAENVARHIFLVLCPSGLCAARVMGLLVHGGRQGR